VRSRTISIQCSGGVDVEKAIFNAGPHLQSQAARPRFRVPHFANIHHDEEYGLQFRLRSSLPEDLVEAANRKTILECGLPVSSGSGYSRKNRENHLREILRNCRRTIDKHVLCYIPFAE
jgi:hypothetical protein